MREHHPDIQPRFAAFMVAKGLEPTPGNRGRVKLWDFCAFIAHWKHVAVRLREPFIRHDGGIADHDAFTDFIWRQVEGES